MPNIGQENLGGGIVVCTDLNHKIGTDAFLLSAFASPKRIETTCDLGCGCGIISLLWFAGDSPPKLSYGLEIQPGAAALARRSAECSNISKKFIAVHGDLRELPECVPRAKFDLVTCNPPYNIVGSGVMSTQDSAQIARHETTCTIDDVCAAAAKLLRFGGRLCICHLPERLPDLLEAMRAHRIEPKRLQLVHKNSQSSPWLVLIEGKLGSKPFLKVEPAIFLHENGAPAGYGSEAKKS